MKINIRTIFTILILLLGLNIMNLEAEVVQMTDSQGQAELPFVLVLENGDIMVMYGEGHHFNKDSIMYYTIYSKANKSWSNPKVAVQKIRSASYAQLAMDRDGDVHMAYMEGNASANREIYYAMYSASSKRWSSRQHAYESPGANSTWPRIQVEDGKIYIVWSHNYDPKIGVMDICMVVNDKGGTWPVSKYERKTVSNLGLSASVHNFFQVRKKNIYCAWIDDNHKPGNWNIYYSEGKYKEGKQDWDWTKALRILPSNSSQYYPALVLDDSGRVHIIFSHKGGPFWHTMKIGDSFTPAKAISSGKSTFNLIAFAKFSKGLIHTVWRETTHSGESLFYGRALPDGTWAPPVKVADCQFPGYPGLDVDDEGDVHVVWSDGPPLDDDHRNIFYAKVELPGIAPNAVVKVSKKAGLIPLKVDFDASQSSDKDGKIIDYKWDFGDGTQATGKEVSHTYTAEGTYKVILSVIDDDFRVGVATEEIEASTGVPFASFEASATEGVAPFSVTFDASSSSDFDGEIVSYLWDFGDGTTSAGKIVSHIYQSGGTYTATLTVTDDDSKKNSTSINIRVYEKPKAKFTASLTSGVAPLEVTFDGTGSSDSDGEIVSYSWDFGDGEAGEGSKITHTYTKSGTFLAVLAVIDNDSYVGTANEWISVRDNPYPPLNVNVERKVNRSFFFKDYINRITWDRNVQNDGVFTIEKYRIYKKKKGEEDSQFSLVSEVNNSTFEYEERKLSSQQEAESFVYAVTAVDNQGRESAFSKSSL